MNDYLKIENSFYNSSSSHSVALWFRIADSLKAGQVFWNTEPHTIEAVAYSLFQQGFKKIGFCLGNGVPGSWSVSGCGNEYFNSPKNLSDWHQLIMVRDNNNWKFYNDGLLVNVYNSTANTGAMNAKLYFGVVYDGTIFGGYFKGNLDDIRIYNRALTQEEISYLAGH